MSKATGRPFTFGAGLALAAFIAFGSVARADVTTDQGGSILFFPKVISDGTRDTIIQISNTGNTLVHAQCYYVNGRLTDPDSQPSDDNPALWQITDFYIWLTRQQPTQWPASRGRRVFAGDTFGQHGAGIDPGAIPPTAQPFTGELACFEIGVDGLPVSGNKLKGEATLIQLTGSNAGDVSKYSAVAIKGGPNAGLTGRNLWLDNDQYNSCSNVLLLDHFADNAPDPVVGSPNNLGACVAGNCPITTEVTLVPCGRDYENADAGRVTVHFDITNEFELHFSADTVVDCWLNTRLQDIGSQIGPNPSFIFTTLGTLSAYTRIETTGGGGLIGVAEETHTDSNLLASRAAFQLQIEGSLFDPDAGRGNAGDFLDPNFSDFSDVITLSGE